jgi:acyl-CoA synthetase (AMP-forming)/AMP-acid ligase II
LFRTKDGFCRTGDLGHYDEDGILYFNGRLKDLIKYQGNHLYPKELESIIQKHPAVAEVVVFGLPHPEVQVMSL